MLSLLPLELLFSIPRVEILDVSPRGLHLSPIFYEIFRGMGSAGDYIALSSDTRARSRTLSC